MTGLNLKQQFLVLFVILFIPVVIVSLYGNLQTEAILKGNVTNAYIELIKQNRQLLNRDLDTISKITNSIMLHPSTQQMLPSANETLRQRIDKYQELDKLLSNYSVSVNGGHAVYYYFFVDDPQNLYNFAPKAPLARIERSGVYFVGDQEKPDWYVKAVENKGKGVLTYIDSFGAGGKPTVAYVKRINDISGNVKGMIGVLVAAGVENKLSDSLPAVSAVKGEVYLTDWNNHILSSTVSHAVGQNLDLHPDVTTPKSASGTISIVTNQSLFITDYSYALQQKLIYLIPIQSLLVKQQDLNTIFWLIFAVYGFFIMLFIVYLWRSIVNPLHKMAVFARSYEPGRIISPILKRKRKDEIGVLSSALYDMAKRLNILVNDKYQAEIREREAQLQLLYQQINPHLLYNTLDSIYWKSVEEGKSNSAEMIKELSVLMKIGLSRGKEVIPLKQELEHAQAYVKLQQKRFEFQFSVHWHIDEETLTSLIPKITLQPLIENAIIHGVRYMEDEGEIQIHSYIQDQDIIITVIDNGFKPVDISFISELLRDHSGRQGYGIRNIHQRIQLYYGKSYGLSYSAVEGGGTCVTVRLPKQSDEELNQS